MRARDIMTTDVQTCTPRTTAFDVARIMCDRDVGGVPVVDPDQNDRVVGIVTDRDIVLGAYRLDRELRKIPVSAVFSAGVCSCKPDDELVDVERMMAEAQVHRMPVVDSQGRVIGLITLGMLARSAIMPRPSADPDIDHVGVAETLASTRRQPLADE